MIRTLYVHVEEASTECAVRILIPKIIAEISFKIYNHGNKHTLLKKLPTKLKNYSQYLSDQDAIVVLIDRDDDDCRTLKATLDAIAAQAGLSTTSRPPPGAKVKTLNRIVIEELEAWFFGDWDAVRAAYPRAPDDIPRKEAFRDPDAIRGGTWEAMARILRDSGYIRDKFRKLETARDVAEKMDPDRNRSASFCAFRDGLRALCGA